MLSLPVSMPLISCLCSPCRRSPSCYYLHQLLIIIFAPPSCHLRVCCPLLFSTFAYTTAPPIKAAAICRRPWRIEVAAGWKSRVSRGVLVCQGPENSAFYSCPSRAVVNHLAQVQLTPRSIPASRFLPFRRSPVEKLCAECTACSCT